MSELRSLYLIDHYIKYKGKKVQVRFREEYFDSVPRPIEDERKLLKEDINIKGVEETIKVNPQGEVLDGHTRIEICEELGWKTIDGKLIKPKFDIREFDTKQEEREYVIKTNLMRRQLNAFQKVRLVARLYNNNSHSKKEQSIYDILLVLNKGEANAKEIGGQIGMHKGNVLKILRVLKEDFCVNYKVRAEDLHKTTQQIHYYHILPKGEGMIWKGRPEAITLKKLGRSIGVGRDMVSRAIFLMEHANSYTLGKLERGDIGIMNAYLDIIKPDKATRTITSYTYLRGDSKVLCPNCGEECMKKELKLVKHGGK